MILSNSMSVEQLEIRFFTIRLVIFFEKKPLHFMLDNDFFFVICPRFDRYYCKVKSERN